MRGYMAAFVNGYAKAMMLFPDFEVNNQASDWEIVGIDLKSSMDSFYKSNKVEKICQTKKIKKSKKKKR